MLLLNSDSPLVPPFTDFSQPPLQYLQAVRMAAARRQLQDTQRRVEHIAAMVGYQDITTFRDTFRREVGMTPTDFRKNARGGALSEQG